MFKTNQAIKGLLMPVGGTLDEGADSPFEGGVGGCPSRHSDGTFQQDTPRSPRAAAPLKGGFSGIAISLLVLIELLSLSPPVQAQLGKRPAKEYITALESPGRLERLQPDKVISRLGLKDGDVVADIGAGSGVFTSRLARAVAPRGKVFAVDIDQELLDYNRGKVQDAKISNVEFILGGFDDPKLSPESCDLIFICDVLHHIEHRQLYLRNLRTYIKPAGRLAIIDYKANWPPGHEQMKYSIEELLDWTKSAGFEKEDEFDLIPDAFFYVFRPIQRDALLKEPSKEKALKIAKSSGP